MKLRYLLACALLALPLSACGGDDTDNGNDVEAPGGGDGDGDGGSDGDGSGDGDGDGGVRTEPLPIDQTTLEVNFTVKKGGESITVTECISTPAFTSGVLVTPQGDIVMQCNFVAFNGVWNVMYDIAEPSAGKNYIINHTNYGNPAFSSVTIDPGLRPVTSGEPGLSGAVQLSAVALDEFMVSGTYRFEYTAQSGMPWPTFSINGTFIANF